MPLLSHVVLCALAAAAFLTMLGLPIARRLEPTDSSCLAIAPILGWATFNAASLPIFFACGLTAVTIAVVAGGAILLSGVIAIRERGGSTISRQMAASVPLWAYGTAALLAMVPALAILPKLVGNGVQLTQQMYDHSKIAIIDDIIRLGVHRRGSPIGGAHSDPEECGLVGVGSGRAPRDLRGGLTPHSRGCRVSPNDLQAPTRWPGVGRAFRFPDRVRICTGACGSFRGARPQAAQCS
jgi:hypothetical protein